MAGPRDDFGPGGELTAAQKAVLAGHVSKPNAETGPDDLFDGPTYRAAKSTFAAQGHLMMPRGQTHYRSGVAYNGQGMPENTSSQHWGHVTGPGRTPTATRGHRVRTPAVAADPDMSPAASAYHFSG